MILVYTTAHSQSRYHFSVLGMEQGLSSSYVWAICQDKYGFVWIGTSYGLNRYDGHNIRQYLNDPKDPFSVPGNTVYWLHKDSDGDIWTACGAAGVARYDYAKNRFEKLLPYETMRRQTGLAAPVWRVGEDQRRRIYIACGGALFRYTKSNQKIENLTPLFKGEIDNYGVAMFIQQGADSLWILTDNGLFLHRLSANTMEHLPYDKEKSGFGSAALIDAEFINPDEMIITTPRSGFLFFNVRTKVFRPAPPPLDPASSKIYSSCGGVIKDHQGRVWVANSVYGLMEYTEAGTLVSVKSVQSYPYPYPEQEGKGMNVYEDRDGNIWYCTSQQGVVWFQPKHNFVNVYRRDYANAASLAGDGVYGFLPAGEGHDMFIATTKGLSRLNGAAEGFYNYPVSVTAAEKFPAASVQGFATSHDTVFMATDFGLSLYDKQTKNFQRYILKDEDHPGKWELFSNYLSRVYVTAPGKLILLSPFGTAARFEPGSGRCYYKDNADSPDALYQFAGINCATKDSLRQCLWLEAGDGELYRYDWATCTATRHHYTADTSIKTLTQISPDPSGALWLGTKKGLIYYNPDTKKGKPYNLPTASQDVFNVAYTKEGAVWATTGSEVVLFTPATGKSVAFNLNTVMPYANITRRSLFVDEQGNAWLGTNRGFCMVDKTGFAPQTGIGAPHLVNFRVFDKPKLFAQPYFELSDIELNWDENFFSFDFSALQYNQAAVPQYAYRLEKFDKNWITSDKNSASYTNVPPGTYTLRLRTLAGLNKWEEAPPIRVHIISPYWQRWWAICLMLAGVATGIYFLYRFRQKQKRNKLMDEAVDYFANSLYGENSVNEICWDIARNCISLLKLEDCVVYLLDEKQNLLVQKAGYGPKNPKDHDILNPITLALGQGVVGTAAGTGKPQLVKDTSKDSRYIVDDAVRPSELAVPIVHEGRSIGVIDSEHTRKNFFTDEHVKALCTIAAISANKIAEAKAEDAARETQIQLLEIKKLLAESQLMALRAQMNPHFVFNCLNSIQECIVTQKYGEASLYLNKFAKLFRSVLNNSGKVMVTLAEEIEVLDLYLSLEHMRFEKSFAYTIYTDEELETDEILIPSMLLQPYVENALWHGLMHKQDDRRLSISFELKSEAVFTCVIDDNGIGRKKALELKEQQSKTKRHVSRGMTISRDRIELLQKQQQHAVLDIIDKYNEAGEPTGTRVVVELSAFLE